MKTFLSPRGSCSAGAERRAPRRLTRSVPGQPRDTSIVVVDLDLEDSVFHLELELEHHPRGIEVVG
jgi:hypothetical protein